MYIKNLKIILIGFAIIGVCALMFIYVNSALGSKDVKQHDENNTEATEIKPAKVYLRLPDDTEYTARLENKYSVSYLLEYLRLNEDFWYEKIEYTYGTELVNVNRIEAPQGFTWKIFFEGEDITDEIENIKLTHTAVYEFKLEERKKQ